MRIFKWDELCSQTDAQCAFADFTGNKGTALTIGGFDGPHLGHQSLFDAVFTAAHEAGLLPGLITFSRSPGAAKKPQEYPGDISTVRIRIERFKKLGFAFVVLIDFSPHFGKMSGGVFFDILVKSVQMRYLAVGPDFRCGHRLDTGRDEIYDLSRRDGFRFDSIRQVELDGIRISSSAVRKAIRQADFSLAERLLGHPFLLDIPESIWKDSSQTLTVPISSFCQILPPAGKYPVILGLLDGSTRKAWIDIDGESVSVISEDSLARADISNVRTAQF